MPHCAQRVHWTANERTGEEGLADWLTRNRSSPPSSTNAAPRPCRLPARTVSESISVPTSRMYRWRLPARWRALGRGVISRSGATARHLATCSATDLALAFRARPGADRRITPKARAATAQRGDDVAFDAALLAPVPDGRCWVQWSREGRTDGGARSGDARTSRPPTSTRRARWSPGATRSGATATARVPGREDAEPLAATRLGRPSSRSWRSTRRWQLVAVPRAMRCRARLSRLANRQSSPAGDALAHLRPAPLGAFTTVRHRKFGRRPGAPVLDPPDWRLARVAGSTRPRGAAGGGALSGWSRRQASMARAWPGLGALQEHRRPIARWWPRWRGARSASRLVDCGGCRSGRQPRRVNNQIEGGAIRASGRSKSGALRPQPGAKPRLGGYPIPRFPKCRGSRLPCWPIRPCRHRARARRRTARRCRDRQNAIRDALDVRVRDLPFTPANVGCRHVKRPRHSRRGARDMDQSLLKAWLPCHGWGGSGRSRHATIRVRLPKAGGAVRWREAAPRGGGGAGPVRAGGCHRLPRTWLYRCCCSTRTTPSPSAPCGVCYAAGSGGAGPARRRRASPATVRTWNVGHAPLPRARIWLQPAAGGRPQTPGHGQPAAGLPSTALVDAV